MGMCDPSLAAVDLSYGMVSAFTTNDGPQAGFHCVPLRCYVECEVGPAVATTFEIMINGAGTGLLMTLTNPATEAQFHSNVLPPFCRITPSDNIKVMALMGGSPVDDPVVTWVFLKCADNSSEC